jgi:hypothetical protein
MGLAPSGLRDISETILKPSLFFKTGWLMSLIWWWTLFRVAGGKAKRAPEVLARA